MTEIEQIMLLKSMNDVKKRINILLVSGLVMTIALNTTLIMTFINGTFGLSLIVLGIYILHEIFYKRAIRFAKEDYSILMHIMNAYENGLYRNETEGEE
jgi:hypothetical protein